MKPDSLKTIKKQLMWNFSIILIANPIINVLIIMTRITKITQLKELVFIIIFAFIICAFTISAYYFITKKLQRMIDQNVQDESSIRYAKRIPLIVSTVFCVPILIATMMLSLLGYFIL